VLLSVDSRDTAVEVVAIGLVVHSGVLDQPCKELAAHVLVAVTGDREVIRNAFAFEDPMRTFDPDACPTGVLESSDMLLPSRNGEVFEGHTVVPSGG
jgi:hypothetical protein